MALPAGLVNAKVTVRRPTLDGPGGAQSGAPTVILRDVAAIREQDVQQQSLSGGTQLEWVALTRFFLNPADGLLVQRGDRVDWEMADSSQSGTNVQVTEVQGPSGTQTSISHVLLVGRG